MEEENNYKCLCGKEFKSKKSLSGHQSTCPTYLESIGKLQWYICDICGKKFIKPQQLQMHYRMHLSTEEIRAISSPRSKVVCPICGRLIGSSVINRHVQVCKGKEDQHPYRLNHDGLVCQFCGKECKNRNSLCNHERVCKENPNRQSTWDELNGIGHVAWNKGLTAETDCRVAKTVQTYRSNQEAGLHTNQGHAHTDETKHILRLSALKHCLGGFNFRRGKILYNGAKLDSSYELKVAQELDVNCVRWERCNRFPYIDSSGKYRTYTPDFYLPEYGVYLDPKNDYILNNSHNSQPFSDKEKISLVETQNSIIVIILDSTQLTWKSILQCIQDRLFFQTTVDKT